VKENIGTVEKRLLLLLKSSGRPWVNSLQEKKRKQVPLIEAGQIDGQVQLITKDLSERGYKHFGRGVDSIAVQ